MSEVSKILTALEQGDSFAADRLFPLVYDELRHMAQAKLKVERAVDSLQATALVHEAYIRLVDGNAGISYKNRRYFFGAAGEAMRRILVDRARTKGSLKHGGERSRVELFDIGTMPDDQELLALDEALRRLAEEVALAAEVVNLKFFAGVSREIIAEMTGMTIHEVRIKWSYARAWLQVAINARLAKISIADFTRRSHRARFEPQALAAITVFARETVTRLAPAAQYE